MTDADELLPAVSSLPRRAVTRPDMPGPAQAPSRQPEILEPVPDPGDDKVMSLVDHLTELRRRLVIAILAIALGGTVGFWLAPRVMVLMIEFLPQQRVQILTVGGGFFLQLRIAVIIGVALASPIVLYQLWAFVAPGLTPHERRAARPWVPLAVVFFLLGVTVAFITLPYAIQFLGGFEIPGRADLVPSAEAYFGFVTMLFLAFGVVMEFPIALVLLAKLGILSVDRLRASRRYVLLGIVIFAVVVTPGGDPVSPSVMAVVMYLLYEVTIILLRRSGARGNDAATGR